MDLSYRCYRLSDQQEIDSNSFSSLDNPSLDHLGKFEFRLRSHEKKTTRKRVLKCALRAFNATESHR
ncbi:hypothetical protein NECAME_09383 [Necator americanus]|uniref:Uncharacterized protein n=1 Tax=Necator americanus TaxID=51031 RepID=W2TGJ2_NECAM|nr:hypothetical protein NECAME_09383 [Necator americanus]ETN80147.1 hypothetical protein NECAME_09383 [Necator americanus]